MPRLRISHLEPALQAIATEDYVFHNWAKTFSCTAELLFTPTSEDEIVKVTSLLFQIVGMGANRSCGVLLAPWGKTQILHVAREHNKTVKVFGSGHSPSDLACTQGIMVNIDKMDGLLRVDKQDCTVTVEGGMSLHKLNAVLAEHGLALSNLGSISDQSIAGVICTATHGTGAHYGCLSTMVSRSFILYKTCIDI